MPLNIDNKWNSNLQSKKIAQDIADEATVLLPDGSKGFGMVTCGDQMAMFSWTSAAAVTLLSYSSLVSGTDTPSHFCIIDSGTQVVFKNNLGSSKRLIYMIAYKL